MVLSYGSRVGTATSPWLSRFIICTIPCDIMIKHVTLNQVLHYFSKSCQILIDGLMPSQPIVGPSFAPGSFQDEAKNLPICGFYKFAFSDLKGDMAFLVTAIGWRSYSANVCCPICFASKVDSVLHYKNCCFDAPWRDTIEDHEARILNAFGPTFDLLISSGSFDRASLAAFRSPLLDIPGFRKERAMNDWMHTGHLGIYPHLCGSVLIDLVDMQLFDGDTRQERLDSASRCLKDWCKHYGINCSMDRFTLERLGVKGNKKSRVKWACLKTKAMNSRVCLAWLSDFCTEKVNSAEVSSQYMKLRASALHHLAQFQHDLDIYPEFVDAQQRRDVYDAGYGFLFQYMHLAHENRSRGLARYNFVPKFHAFCHLLDMISEYGINIRFYQCYGDEDYMGKVGKISAATHKLAMPTRVVQRLAVLTCLEM